MFGKELLCAPASCVKDIKPLLRPLKLLSICWPSVSLLKGLACRRVQLRTCCNAAPEEDSAVTERGEGWKIEAEASPLEGDALEARLTEQVEEGTAGINPEIAQTCESCSGSLWGVLACLA